MTRSDLLLALSVAALEGNRQAARSALSAIAAEETHKGHTKVAARLRGLIDASEFTASRPSGDTAPTKRMDRGVTTRVPTRKLSEIHLSEANRESLDAIILEQKYARELRSSGLEPRHRILLTGAPGTGKTSLSEAIAAELAVPFLVAQYEDIIGSYLGETSSRLHAVFMDAAAGPSVLFLDEFDTLAKERGDQHDTGEVKRVVSTLLLQIDSLPSHVVVIAATNHPELLDRAAWRRFQTRLELPMPTADERAAFATFVAARVGLITPNGVVEEARMERLSFAGVEELVMTARRNEVLKPYRRR